MRTWASEKEAGEGPPRVDPADPRIDVSAKFSLQRLLRGPLAPDASRLLLALRDGTLAGIYGDDLRATADLARRHGTQRWLLVPKVEDAALVLEAADPHGLPPTVVFRDAVRSQPARLDAALVRASRTLVQWLSGGLRCEVGTPPPSELEGAGGAGLSVANTFPLCNVVTTDVLCPPVPKGTRPISGGGATFTVHQYGPHCDFSAPAGWVEPVVNPVTGLLTGLVRFHCGKTNGHGPAWRFCATVGIQTGSLAESETWEHGFIQTVEREKWLATYTKELARAAEVVGARDALRPTREPWMMELTTADAVLPQNRIDAIRHGGPLTFTETANPGLLSPELRDDPLLDIDERHPFKPDATLCGCRVQGLYSVWLVAKRIAEAPTKLVFLRHARIALSIRWTLPPGRSPSEGGRWTAHSRQVMVKDGVGQGPVTPVVTGPLANEQLKTLETFAGAPCAALTPEAPPPLMPGRELPPCPSPGI